MINKVPPTTQHKQEGCCLQTETVYILTEGVKKKKKQKASICLYVKNR